MVECIKKVEELGNKYKVTFILTEGVAVSAVVRAKEYLGVINENELEEKALAQIGIFFNTGTISAETRAVKYIKLES